LQIPGGVGPSDRFAVVAFAVFSVTAGTAGLAGEARAQSPGVHRPRQHAEPPLPEVLPSPMPSLPPPLQVAPGEMPTVPPAGFPGWLIDRPGYTARISRDGAIDFGNRLIGDLDLVDPVAGMGPRFSFDSTDALSRLFDWGDPYLADKLALMDSTRAERIELRREHDQERMERALVDLPYYLQAVWCVPEWSLETRKRVLFQLWDEVAEDGNELVVEGGRIARSEIARFIANHLPVTSADAFTAAELAAFNRERTSRNAFQPYAPAPAPRPGDEGDDRDADRVVIAGHGLEVTQVLAAF
jgi:hypothetical protein